MAISREYNTRSMSLLTITTDGNGKTKTTKKALSNLKPSAADENIIAVANSIKAIMDRSVDEIRVNENITLNQQ